MSRLDPNVRVRTAFADFADVSLDAYFADRPVSPGVHALALARDVLANVPAYQRFLVDAGHATLSLDTMEEFNALPFTDKNNYIRRYPGAALCRYGSLETCDMYAVSSGSTGEPGLWPRFVTDEYAVARRFEQIFVDSFELSSCRTLAVVCFALGTWVGGMYTVACCRHLAAKGYPLAVVAPGNNIAEILRVVAALSPRYEQTVLLGYPPFIKDVIDAGCADGLGWAQYKIKMVFAGEVFSEEWRDLIYTRTGSDRDYCRDSASMYGTADAGVLGVETPLSVGIRRFLAGNARAARELFGASRLPSLFQYDPWSRYFEYHNGTLRFTGDNGVPLVRYDIGDEGGLIAFDAMQVFLRDWGFDPGVQLPGMRVRSLPFVYVFGRSHFVLSYYGANVYPENVSVGLEQPAVQQWVTGKFVMSLRESETGDSRLHIVIELAPNECLTSTREQEALEAILAQLRRLNSEFAHYVPDHCQRPQLEFRSAGDPEWFPKGVKHRYTRPPKM